MANKIYFKTKGYGNAIFSNDIFKEPGGKISLIDSLNLFNDLNNETGIRNYTNLQQIIEDDKKFMILTDASFTESELKMIQDLVYAHGRHIYGDKKVMNLVNKIEHLLMTRCYLPDNKDEIINK